MLKENEKLVFYGTQNRGIGDTCLKKNEKLVFYGIQNRGIGDTCLKKMKNWCFMGHRTEVLETPVYRGREAQ